MLTKPAHPTASARTMVADAISGERSDSFGHVIAGAFLLGQGTRGDRRDSSRAKKNTSQQHILDANNALHLLLLLGVWGLLSAAGWCGGFG